MMQRKVQTADGTEPRGVLFTAPVFTCNFPSKCFYIDRLFGYFTPEEVNFTLQKKENDIGCYLLLGTTIVSRKRPV